MNEWNRRIACLFLLCFILLCKELLNQENEWTTNKNNIDMLTRIFIHFIIYWKWMRWNKTKQNKEKILKNKKRICSNCFNNNNNSVLFIEHGKIVNELNLMNENTILTYCFNNNTNRVFPKIFIIIQRIPAEKKLK